MIQVESQTAAKWTQMAKHQGESVDDGDTETRGRHVHAAPFIAGVFEVDGALTPDVMVSLCEYCPGDLATSTQEADVVRFWGGQQIEIANLKYEGLLERSLGSKLAAQLGTIQPAAPLTAPMFDVWAKARPHVETMVPAKFLLVLTSAVESLMETVQPTLTWHMFPATHSWLDSIEALPKRQPDGRSLEVAHGDLLNELRTAWEGQRDDGSLSNPDDHLDALRKIWAQRELVSIREAEQALAANRSGVSQRKIAKALGRSQSDVHRLLRKAKAGLPSQTWRVILRATAGEITRGTMIGILRAGVTRGVHEPGEQSDGYSPGTLDEIRSAFVDDLLSQEEYEELNSHAPPRGEQ